MHPAQTPLLSAIRCQDRSIAIPIMMCNNRLELCEETEEMQ